LINSLPDLQKHPICRIDRYSKANNESSNNTEFQPEHFSNSNSGRLFSILYTSPVYQSDGGLEGALNTLFSMQSAHLEAINMKSSLLTLQDLAKRLWTLNPDNLCKQLDRSLLLPKIRDIISNPATGNIIIIFGNA
jgi:hypothetical protein